jgi:iron complex transport system permease protein
VPRILFLLLLTLVLFALELAIGSVHIPIADVWNVLSGGESSSESTRIILLESRLPRALTAIISGAGLALCGLLMQTLFRNPLAGPSVLGISSGASLGVALLVLASGGILSGSAALAVTALSAMAGAFAVLLIVVVVAKRLSDNATLLIFGIMLSFFTGAIVDALQFKSSNDSLRSFINWGMGSFAETNYSEIFILTLSLVLGKFISIWILPRLNLLLLGEDYAQSMGVNTKQTRLLIILATGTLAGIITAFCGPVSFIGLAVPHIIRVWLRSSDHSRLYPLVIIAGSAIALMCDLLARLMQLPLNTIASALGAPVVIFILFRGSNSKSII